MHRRSDSLIQKPAAGKPIDLFADAPCLSPWYFAPSQPALSRAGVRLQWDRIEKINGEYVGLLALQGRDGESYGLLKTYAYLLPRPERDGFLIWARERPTLNGGGLRMAFYRTDALQPIPEIQSMGVIVANDKGTYYHFRNRPDAEAIIPIDPERGEQPFTFPDAFQGFDEFFAVAEITNLYKEPRADWHNTAIIQISPNRASVAVYPQDWFNAPGPDFGYEWITRAVRDRRTGLIRGQGIRVSDFILDETGRQLRS